jgi:hypothetical protein
MSRSCSVGSGAALGYHFIHTFFVRKNFCIDLEISICRSGGMASLSEYANFSVLIPKVARQALRPVLEQCSYFYLYFSKVFLIF